MSAGELSPDLKALAQEALAHQNAGRYGEAAQAYAAVLARAPDVWQACYNLGLVFQALGRVEESAGMYVRAVQLNPGFAQGFNNLGNVLKAAGNLTAAAEAYQQALALQPGLAEASYNLATLHQASNRLDQAAELFQRAILSNPAHGPARDGLYRSLIGLGRHEAAIQALLAWESDQAPSPEMVTAGLALCRHLGDPAREQRYLKLALEWPFEQFTPAQYAPVLAMLQYFDVARADLLVCYRRYDQAVAATRPQRIATLPRRGAGPLRIGYVSGDFRQHVMGRLMLDIVGRHDREAFSILLISTCPRSQHDATTAQFRALADGFADVSELDDLAAARSIADADVDILVDLAGHTSSSRPGIYAHRPAPVVVTHLGYHGCLGLGAIDYKLTDRVADLPDAGNHQVEKPYFLDACLFPLGSPATQQGNAELRHTLSLEGRFVLAAFVNVLKLSPRCLDTWSKVLAAIPEAMLLFSPVSPGEKESIERAMSRSGIDRGRFAIIAVPPDPEAMRARYALVHAVLDTFPYAGGDTTLAALAQGVPVITLAGERQGERIGASILTHLGFPELIAASEESFVELAVRLASDTPFREGLRKRIGEAWRQASVDGGGHVRALESAYRDLASRRPRESMGLPANHFHLRLQDALRQQQAARDGASRAAVAQTFSALRAEQPDFPPLLRAQAELAKDMGDMPLAADCFSRLVQTQPEDLDARLSLAGFLLDIDAPADALKVLDDVATGNETGLRFLRLRTRAHAGMGDWDAARLDSAGALAHAPEDPGALFWHGTALSQCGQPEAALSFLNRVLILDPGHAEAAHNAGVLLAEFGNFADAETVLKRPAGTSAAGPARWRLLAILRHLGRWADWGKGAAAYSKAYPGTAKARLTDMRLARMAGELEREEKLYFALVDEAIATRPDAEAFDLASELLASLPFRDAAPQAATLLRQRWAEALRALHPPLGESLLPAGAIAPVLAGRKRIAYLVDFSSPYMGELACGLLENHDLSRFECVLFACGPLPPAARARLADAIPVVSLAGLDEKSAARRIASHAPALLVDMAGLGFFSKPGIHGHGTVPVVAFPGLVVPGLPAGAAWRLSDSAREPPGSAGEDIPVLLVEGSSLPLPALGAATGMPPTRPAGPDTPAFAIFASCERVTSRCLALWAAIAARLPAAHFFILPAAEHDAAALHAMLLAGGIPANRLSTGTAMRPGTRVDIALDAVPGSDYFSAHMALRLGIPLVTLQGGEAAHRTAAALSLHLGGIFEVTQSGRDYVDAAVALAGDPERLNDSAARVAAAGREAHSMADYTARCEKAWLRALEAPPPGPGNPGVAHG